MFGYLRFLKNFVFGDRKSSWRKHQQLKFITYAPGWWRRGGRFGGRRDRRRGGWCQGGVAGDATGGVAGGATGGATGGVASGGASGGLAGGRRSGGRRRHEGWCPWALSPADIGRR
jgi:hypothetical protein